MSQLTEHEEAVGRYYDDVIFDAEVARLKELFPVEYAITARHLRRWIPEGSTVAEVGVGGGLYSDSSPWQAKLNELSEAEAEAWLDLIEQTGTAPEAFGLADHYLYVGRRSARP